MSESAIFTRRGARLLVLASGLTLGVTLFFMTFGEVPTGIHSAGADTFSRSALGYRALAEFLEQDVPVLISRRHSELKASPSAPLLLLEPSTEPEDLERLSKIIDVVRQREIPTVVVLPKWRGYSSGRDGKSRDWVSSVEPRSLDEAKGVLRAVLGLSVDADVVRRQTPGFVAMGGSLQLVSPQLIRSSELEVLSGDDNSSDALVVRVPDASIYVISDPDLLNTAGLVRDGHAHFVHRFLVSRLEPSSFVIDEALHGYGRNESIWSALLDFPLICVSLHLVALLALGLWATTGRFGQPLDPPSRLPPGKMTLVENTARLLALTEHGQHAITRYLQLTVYRAARFSARPPSTFDRVDYLAEAGRRRGISEDLGELAREIAQPPQALTPRRTLALAGALYRWRQKFMNSSKEARRL